MITDTHSTPKLHTSPHPEVVRQQSFRSTKKDPLILVVEDQPSEQRYYELGIRSWKLPVRLEIAQEGFEGLMKISEHKPDILITDLRMPGMDGIQMIRCLQRMPQFFNTTIIVVSSMDNDDISAHGGLPKGVMFFPKPAPLEQIKKYILNYIDI